MKGYSIDYTLQTSECLIYSRNYYKPTKLYVRLVGVSIDDLKKLSTLYAYGKNVTPFIGSIPAYKNIIKSTDNGVCEHVFPNVGGPYLHTIIGTTQR